MILLVFRNFRLVRGMRMLFFAAGRHGEVCAGLELKWDQGVWRGDFAGGG